MIFCMFGGKLYCSVEVAELKRISDERAEQTREACKRGRFWYVFVEWLRGCLTNGKLT